MTHIIIKINKPIFVGTQENLDWWKVIKMFAENPNFDEWRGHHTVNGLTLDEFCKSQNIVLWQWNILLNDWVEQ